MMAHALICSLNIVEHARQSLCDLASIVIADVNHPIGFVIAGMPRILDRDTSIFHSRMNVSDIVKIGYTQHILYCG